MNREERTRPDDTPAEATSAPTDSTDVGEATDAASGPTHSTDVDAASDVASSLARVDALAVSMLPSKALARYHTYKEVLLAREKDEAAIISTLTLFIWDLSERR